MIADLKHALKRLLRWSERYTRTDMVYLASGSFWVSLKASLFMLMSLGSMVAFAHLATQELYGEYQYVLATIGLVTVLGLPGMKQALVRSVAQGYDRSLIVAFREKMHWSLLAALALLAASGWYVYQGNLELGGVFALGAVSFPIINSTQIFTQFWRGKQRFQRWALFHVLFQAASMGAVVSALFFTDDNVVLILAMFFGAQAVVGVGLFLVTLRAQENTRVDTGLVSFSRHLTVMGAIGTIAGQLDKIILWHFVGPAQLAVYSFAADPVNKVKGLLPIRTLALPRLSKNRVNTAGRKRKIFSKFVLLFALTIPMAIGVALVAPFVYTIIFPQYVEATQYIPLLSVLIALTPFAVLSLSLTAEMKTRSLYVTQSVVPVTKIALFLVLTPLYGVWGVIVALVVSQLIGNALATYFFWRM